MAKKDYMSIEYRCGDYIFNITCCEDGELNLGCTQCKTRPGYSGTFLKDIENFDYDLLSIFKSSFGDSYNISVDSVCVELSSCSGNEFSVVMSVVDSSKDFQDYCRIASESLNILIDSDLLYIKDIVILTEKEAEQFLDLLEDPPEPNEKLLKAVEDWKKHCLENKDCGCL